MSDSAAVSCSFSRSSSVFASVRIFSMVQVMARAEASGAPHLRRGPMLGGAHPPLPAAAAHGQSRARDRGAPAHAPAASGAREAHGGQGPPSGAEASPPPALGGRRKRRNAATRSGAMPSAPSAARVPVHDSHRWGCSCSPRERLRVLYAAALPEEASVKGWLRARLPAPRSVCRRAHTLDPGRPAYLFKYSLKQCAINSGPRSVELSSYLIFLFVPFNSKHPLLELK